MESWVELTDDVSGVSSVAGKDGSICAGGSGTSDLGSCLPNDLGKVTGSRAISWLAEVVESYLSVFNQDNDKMDIPSSLAQDPKAFSIL